MNRRQFVLTTLGALALGRPALAAPHRIEVFKSPTCGCCSAWIAHMEDAGFAVEARDVDQGRLNEVKASVGLTPELASCHTGLIEGYVIEGHVPAEDVQRLLAERPDALGLSVPGMPIGSPGMEMDGRSDAYATLLIRKDGSTEVWARHG
ncbi:DUF411 domain-containing protein [Litorisediminicola beolgyonensis]|uniref:DUF411 domain-containing protein n=1 Tax=Litorisediminicola beolgyonensis TaxID=1173614 RepID=A0ABW3ZM01_9RHOB